LQAFISGEGEGEGKGEGEGEGQNPQRIFLLAIFFF
jgi:hypothetical protein